MGKALSASSFETYVKCPFNHFCRYTLGLREKKTASFGMDNIGTFIHAVLENVTVSNASFVISGDIYPQEYTLGTFVGNGGNRGIDISGINVTLAEGAESKISIACDKTTGEITLTFIN